MASNTDFVQYIADQCSGAGEIMVKKMFGDYGIYCGGKIFGLICDDCFYLKPTDAVRPLLRVVDMRSERRARFCQSQSRRNAGDRQTSALAHIVGFNS